MRIILILNIKARADVRAEEWNFQTREKRRQGTDISFFGKYGSLGEFQSFFVFLISMNANWYVGFGVLFRPF